jgi:hypothetical protein
MTIGIGMRKAGPTVIGPAAKTGPTEFGPAGGHRAHTARGLDWRPPGTYHWIAGCRLLIRLRRWGPLRGAH